MKKVLIITYYWPPSGGAGVQRWLKFSKYLPSFGIEPYILTVDSRYASYPQKDEGLADDVPRDLKVYRTRSFEPLNLISGLLGKDKMPYGGFSNVNKNSVLQTILRFIRGNFFIPDARKGWNRYAWKKAAGLIHRYNIPTVITTGPPHSTHLTGLKLKKKLGIEWIADFRDPWTDIYYYADMLHTPLARRIDGSNEKRVLETADKIIVNCRSNKKLLESKIDAKETGKFSVITNGYDEDDFSDQAPKYPAPSDEFVITYSGTMSEHYRPGVFFSVLSKLVEKNRDVKFRFTLAGNLSASAERQIKEYGIYDIFDYPGYISHPKLVGLLKSSSALLYLFPETVHDKGVAGKLFEYLAVKKPVIAIGPGDSDAAAIIDECAAGRNFAREDELPLFEYLVDLVRDFKTNGQTEAGNDNHLYYTRKKLTSVLARLI